MRIAFWLDSAQSSICTIRVPLVIPLFETNNNFLDNLLFCHFLSYNRITMTHRCPDCVGTSIVITNFVIDGEITNIVCELSILRAVACVNNSVKFGNHLLRDIFEINVCATVWVPGGNKNVAIVVVAIGPRNWRDGGFRKILF